MRLFTLPLYFLCALVFTAFYYQPPINSPGISLEALTELRGATPYQYRLLLPLLARVILWCAPISLHAIYAFLTFAFTFGLFVVWRDYLQAELGQKAPFYALALLYSLLWNYVFVSGIRYPWDVPAIFFFVLGLVLIQRARWRLFYATFVLACLNRETSCFLICAFVLLTWRRQPLRWVVWNALLQTLLWLSIKMVLTRYFAQNSGAKVFENHWISNLNFIANVLRNPLGSLDWLLLTFGWMFILIALSWRVLPDDYKRLLLIAPFFLLGMMLVGDFGQMRIHNELVPILLAPALWSFDYQSRQWQKRLSKSAVTSVP